MPRLVGESSAFHPWTWRTLSRSRRGVVLMLLAALVAPRGAWGHGSHGQSAGPVGHVGAGIATFRPDDSLELAIDLFGYLTASAAAGWRTGEPLGAGGKIPQFYNQYLYQMAPFERTALAKRDYWPQYRDFSYNPLWQPSQLGMRAQYQFVPSLRGTVTAVYFGSLDRVTVEPNPIEIEELFARWTPERLPGFSVSFGHLLMVGSYAPSFDQFPMESFQLNGAAVAYEGAVGPAELRFQLAGGRTPLGRTTAVERIDPDPTRNHPALDGVRERTHLYTTAAVGLANGLSGGLIAGYQILPADQTTTNDPAPSTHRWMRSSGWHVGAEVGLARPGQGHSLTFTYGQGDVELATAAPDYVYVTNPVDARDRFTRAGSRVYQAVYSTHLSTRRFRLFGGIWGQWRRPAPLERTWPVFDEATGQDASLTVRSQAFRAVKINVEPAVTIGPVAFGVRLDGVLYPDKTATTGTVEAQVDEALRPRLVTTPDGLQAPVTAPSRWEREAVDSLIVSPFVDLWIGEVLRVRGSWSGAWYTSAVHRQRQNANFHGNVTLSAWLVYRFGVPAAAAGGGPP
jgi:hypothetical protein